MHTIADTLTRIRNAQLRKARYVLIPKTNMAKQLVMILSNEGFLEGVEELSQKTQKVSQHFLRVSLPEQSQTTKAKPHVMKVVSRPGCRVYVNCKNIPTPRQNMSVCILSTSKGLLTNKEARLLGVGGEVLCTIW
uniref:Small ribosomal subunit protein uS8c n=1 Tax=Prasinoderma coloniale TaxID=156133 RepID=A0A088CK46_9VIRI|nr:ribosomal protein S8 [Prasinoderma coloniale]AID67569.1 ribosomal protein S8 [Prasinoderma coloniale]